MGLRKKAYFIGAFLTVFSPLASALGLGEITLHSALNQPLDAEIQLLHVRDLSEREILAGLATSQEFERAGVDRPFFLGNLRFRVEMNSPRGAVIKVSSSEVVREPFLNFVVAAQWPSGRLLREYTLLVDLPVFTDTRVAPVAAARTSRPAAPAAETPSPQPRPQPAARPAESRPAPAAASRPAAVTGETYGPVGANENLWGIASRVRPGETVSVQQTMLAIQRLNPDAFINDNINLLRRGQVLRVPDLEEVRRLSSRDALQEVSNQNRHWRERGRQEEAPRAQLEGSRRIPESRPAAPVAEGRVTLSSRDGDSQSGTGTSTGLGGDGSRVANDLATTQEELDAATRESAELKSRLRSVEEQIETMERLVQISSEEMRALELAAQRLREQPDAAADGALVDGESASGDGESEGIEGEETVASEEGALAGVDTQSEPVVEAEPPVAVAPEPVAQPAPQQQSWVDVAKDKALYIAGGLGALILAIGAFLFVRNRKEETYDDLEETFNPQADGLNTDFDLGDTATRPLEDDDRSALFHTQSLEETLEPVHAEAETEDVVGECDIHIAYAQYEQAEEKLLRALERDPAHVAARLKLLEAFAAQGDAARFDEHYARLLLIGDQESLDRAAMLRGSIDDAPEFDASRHDTSAFSALVGGALVGGAVAGGFASSFAEGEALGDEMADSDVDFDDDTLRFDFEQLDEIVDSASGAASDVDEALFETDLAEELIEDLGDEASAETLAFDLSESDDILTEDEASLFEEASDLDGEGVTGEERWTAEFSENLVAEPAEVAEPSDVDFSDFDSALSADEIDGEVADFEAELLAEDPQSALDDETLAVVDDFAAVDGASELDDAAAALAVAAAPLADFAEDAGSDGESVDLADVEADLDLDGDVNLDALDQELDALASNFDDSEALADESNIGLVEGDFALVESDVDGLALESPSDNFDDLLNELDSATPGSADDFAEEVAEWGTDLSADEDTFAEVSPVDANDALEDLIDDSASAESAIAAFDAGIAEDGLSEDSFSVEALSEEGIVAESFAFSDDLAADTDWAQSDDNAFELPDVDPENDDDSGLEFLTDSDETATKLDLARAYIDMGDTDGAKDILDEIFEEGNEQQKQEAESLLTRIGF